MENLWAPWRMEFIMAEKTDGCVLCEKPKENTDVQNYILYRGKNNYVMLNLYPYNPGHLMILPYDHIADLSELSDEGLMEHSKLVSRCITILRETMNPGGFNIGMNLGKAGGAGVQDHIHTHVVPRWWGDANFMAVVANIRVVPEGLNQTYAKLVASFK